MLSYALDLARPRSSGYSGCEDSRREINRR